MTGVVRGGGRGVEVLSELRESEFDNEREVREKEALK
jgi:hypothetical protein